MKTLQNVLPESEFLEYPESISPSFVFGMLVTSIVTLTLLAIPALVMYLSHELKIRMKAPITN